jgi:hypothetical protein
MDDSIADLIYSLNYIDSMIWFNNQEAKLLMHSPLDNLNRINRLYADNRKLIQNKKQILQNDNLKHLTEKQIQYLQICCDKKIN